MNKKSDLIYGIRAVLEAVKSGRHLERVFVQKDLKGDLIKELMKELHKRPTPISKVPVERVNKLTRKNHQGVVALISPVQYHQMDHLVPALFEKGKVPLLLLLDEITDVRNFGAIARTAECLGVDGIIIPLRKGAQINEDGIKTSAGAFHYLPVCREKSLPDAIRYLQQCGINIVACTEKSSKLLREVDYNLPTAIVIGSEEYGISREIVDLSNDTVKVAMEGKISSLNVSVATGMVLYEAHRQRT